MASKNNSQQQRINSSFYFISDQIEAGQVAKAFDFFSNVIRTESQLAREETRELLKTTAVLDKAGADPE